MADALGAVLAGGAGTRIGGDKAARLLNGRPLISYPLEVLGTICARAVVVTKPSVVLPPLGDTERWDEPEHPRHPLVGLVTALARARTHVLVCAADMPFVTPAACRVLLEAGHTPAVAHAAGRLEPLLGVYSPSSLARLRAAAPDAPLTATVEALDPLAVALPERVVRSVNTAAELAAAELEARSDQLSSNR